MDVVDFADVCVVCVFFKKKKLEKKKKKKKKKNKVFIGLLFFLFFFFFFLYACVLRNLLSAILFFVTLVSVAFLVNGYIGAASLKDIHIFEKKNRKKNQPQKRRR